MVLDYFAASGRLAVTDESRNSALYQKILKKLGLRTEARQQVHLSGSKRMRFWTSKAFLYFLGLCLSNINIYLMISDIINHKGGKYFSEHCI